MAAQNAAHINREAGAAHTDSNFVQYHRALRWVFCHLLQQWQTELFRFECRKEVPEAQPVQKR